MKTQYRNPILLIFTLFLIVGCASHYAPETMRDPYGFFSGLWHGSIAALTISVNIISWTLSLIGINFLQDIQIIGRPNTGFFYFSGFGIGFSILPLFR